MSVVGDQLSTAGICQPNFQFKDPNVYRKVEAVGPIVLRFPLAGGNEFMLTLKSAVTPKEFQTIKALIALAEDSFVREEIDI